MNQADRKEFDLIHNKIDQIKEDIDDLKQTMNQAHTKTDESLSFMKENLFNPHEGLWAETGGAGVCSLCPVWACCG